MNESCCMPDRQLSELLGESVSQATQREQTALLAATAIFPRALVIFGAGGIGHKVLGALRSLGIEPLAFADNNRALWGQTMGGLKVMRPKEAAEQFGRKATFLAAIWSPGAGCPRSIRQLTELGCRNVISFLPLLWKCPEAFGLIYGVDLPHRVLQDREAVEAGYRLWADDASRNEYLAQLRLRLFADFDALPPPVDDEQYFPDDLFSLSDDETFVDCGACVGDTIKGFLRRRGCWFSRILALEPDVANFQKLQSYVASLPPEIGGKVQLQQRAVGAANGRVRFTADGASSAVNASGAGEVECVALDNVEAGAAATYVKMDIEGAEADAIAGATRLIRHRLPLLAITVYHKQDDLWRIPLLIHSLSDEYRLYLRPHDAVFDLVCYAVPPDRRRPQPDTA